MKFIFIAFLVTSTFLLQDIYGQTNLLTNNYIGADNRIDSLFRTNFYYLEKDSQTFIIKHPEFSLTEFDEPENTSIYQFIELITELSGIKCDSIIHQKGWNHSYYRWDKEIVEKWETWYMKNGKYLKWNKVVSLKESIDSKWIKD